MSKADDFWRPIATAPRDGSAILLYVPRQGEAAEDWIGAGYFERPDDLGEGGYWKGENPTVSAILASHWAPLPEPPSTAGRGTLRRPPKPASWRVPAGAVIILSLASAAAWLVARNVQPRATKPSVRSRAIRMRATRL